jgi:hypothetical protein
VDFYRPQPTLMPSNVRLWLTQYQPQRQCKTDLQKHQFA